MRMKGKTKVEEERWKGKRKAVDDVRTEFAC